MSSLRPSRAFLIRRERKKKRGKEGHPFAIEKGNGIYPKKKREEKVREKERDLEDRIPQRTSHYKQRDPAFKGED